MINWLLLIVSNVDALVSLILYWFLDLWFIPYYCLLLVSGILDLFGNVLDSKSLFYVASPNSNRSLLYECYYNLPLALLLGEWGVTGAKLYFSMEALFTFDFMVLVKLVLISLNLHFIFSSFSLLFSLESLRFYFIKF